MSRYWVYLDSKIQGPVDVPSLRKMTGFSLLSQVCEEGAQSWRIADEVVEIKSYFLSPPRPNSFALDVGNAAPKLDELPPLPLTEELLTPDLKADKLSPDGKKPVGKGGLRAECPTCGYKNPRDITLCMKCGESLGIAEEKKADVEAADAKAPAVPVETPPPTPVAPQSAVFEISTQKLVIGGVVLACVAVAGIFGVRAYMKKKQPVKAPVPSAVVAPKVTKPTEKKTAKPVSKAISKAVAAPVREESDSEAVEEAPSKTEEVPYHIVSEATPVPRRASRSNADSDKRRADKGLWSAQEEQAIRQVQRNRIYGGLRTIERNVEVLMQILRDREYSAAFENGKRIYLFNDLDWSASMKDGPVYEVRLRFSGGREPDGTARKPLQFAFRSDLERGTVEPGGDSQVKSNTLHAFFDESRIPPEDRRPIAKDTEELVLAAQPGASPLALDTILRQYVKTYGQAPATRIADAYGLSNVKRKLLHDPKLGTDAVSDGTPVVTPKTQETVAKPVVPEVRQEKKVVAFPPSKGGQVDFKMEKGAKGERTFFVQATSKATPQRLWEVLTGYDNHKQFIPDLLVSERQGQDGSAVIVHTTHLTRFMFFVFKLNLHLRVIEQPKEYTLQFERIAGEFESFRGSVELKTDPATRDTRIAFSATMVPSSRTTNWVIEKMARKLLVNQMEAIRAKAESL